MSLLRPLSFFVSLLAKRRPRRSPIVCQARQRPSFARTARIGLSPFPSQICASAAMSPPRCNVLSSGAGAETFLRDVVLCAEPRLASAQYWTSADAEEGDKLKASPGKSTLVGQEVRAAPSPSLARVRFRCSRLSSPHLIWSTSRPQHLFMARVRTRDWTVTTTRQRPADPGPSALHHRPPPHIPPPPCSPARPSMPRGPSSSFNPRETRGTATRAVKGRTPWPPLRSALQHLRPSTTRRR